MPLTDNLVDILPWLLFYFERKVTKCSDLFSAPGTYPELKVYHNCFTVFNFGTIKFCFGSQLKDSIYCSGYFEMRSHKLIAQAGLKPPSF
jgi:hypothetical protein